MGTGAMREWYVKGHKQSLCSLDFFTDYMLTIEADNGFGYSPSATSNFKTDQAGKLYFLLLKLAIVNIINIKN